MLATRAIVGLAALAFVSASTAEKTATEAQDLVVCTSEELAAWKFVWDDHEFSDCRALYLRFWSFYDSVCLAIAQEAARSAPFCAAEGSSLSKKDEAERVVYKFTTASIIPRKLYIPQRNLSAPVCTFSESAAWFTTKHARQTELGCRKKGECDRNCVSFYRDLIRQAPTCRDPAQFRNYSIREAEKGWLANCLHFWGKPLDEDADLYEIAGATPLPTPSPSPMEGPRVCSREELDLWEPIVHDAGYQDCIKVFGSCTDPACLESVKRAANAAPNCVEYDFALSTALELAEYYDDKCTSDRANFDPKVHYTARRDFAAPMCQPGVYAAWSHRKPELQAEHGCDWSNGCDSNCTAYSRSIIRNAPICREASYLSNYTVQEREKEWLLTCLTNPADQKRLDMDPDLNLVSKPPSPTTSMPTPAPTQAPTQAPTPAPTTTPTPTPSPTPTRTPTPTMTPTPSPTSNAKCSIEANFDFVGNDIGSVSGVADSAACCEHCTSHAACHAYTWTDFNNGTCWLKSGRGTVVAKPGVVSAVVRGPAADNQVCPSTSYLNVDIVGNDVGTAASPDPSGCCSICKATLGCRAYTWSSWMFGTCFLKSSIVNTVYSVGVVSADVYAFGDVPGQEVNTDLVGSDLESVASASVTDCVKQCTGVCRAVTWVGGTCYKKTRAGERVAKAGAVSVQLTAQSPPLCTEERSIDFVGNDLSNRAAKTASDCCSLCSATSGCKAWTWSPYNSGWCYLKSAKGSTASSAGVISGVA